MSYFINDLRSAVLGGTSIRPAAARTTTTTGEGVDLSSGDGQAFAIVDIGTITDGTHTLKFQESKNDNTASEHEAADAYTDITGIKLDGSSTAVDTLALTSTVSNGPARRVSFRHAEPWVRAVVTVTGSPGTGGTYSVFVGAPKRSLDASND